MKELKMRMRENPRTQEHNKNKGGRDRARQKAAAQKTKQEDNKGADYRVNTKKLPAQKTKQELGDQPRAKATVEICAGEAEVA